MAQGYFWSIMFMLSVPSALVVTFTVIVRRMIRAENAVA